MAKSQHPNRESFHQPQRASVRFFPLPSAGRTRVGVPPQLHVDQSENRGLAPNG